MMFEVTLLISASSLGLFLVSIGVWRLPPGRAFQAAPRGWLRRWFGAWLVVTAVLYLLLWALAQYNPQLSQSIFFVSLTALLLTTAGNLYRNLSRRPASSSEGEPTQPDNARTAVGALLTIKGLMLVGYTHFLWLSVGHPLAVLPLSVTIVGAAVGVWLMIPHHSKTAGWQSSHDP